MLHAQGLAPVLRRAAVALAIATVALPLAACSDEGKLVLHSSTGDYSFNVDVVDTPESRAKGLMFVQELADDAGMLFDFKEERPVSFWMRNTFIPLDMVFVGSDGKVINVENLGLRPIVTDDSENERTVEGPSADGGPAAQTPAELVDSDGVPHSLPDYLDQLEREAIRKALEKTGQNRTAAAKLLGITFRALRYRMQRLEL